MVVLWWTEISAWLIALVAMLAIHAWHRDDPSAESNAAFTIALWTFLVASVGIPVHFFFGEPFVSRRRKSREAKRKALRIVLDRIEREIGNFEHINSQGTYSGPLHRRAVEETSFRLLAQDLEKIRHYWFYRDRVRRAIEYTRTKQVSGLIPLLNDIAATLRRDIKRLESVRVV